jgi:hypothetical protein
VPISEGIGHSLDAMRGYAARGLSWLKMSSIRCGVAAVSSMSCRGWGRRNKAHADIVGEPSVAEKVEIRVWEGGCGRIRGCVWK